MNWKLPLAFALSLAAAWPADGQYRQQPTQRQAMAGSRHDMYVSLDSLCREKGMQRFFAYTPANRQWRDVTNHRGVAPNYFEVQLFAAGKPVEITHCHIAETEKQIQEGYLAGAKARGLANPPQTPDVLRAVTSMARMQALIPASDHIGEMLAQYAHPAPPYRGPHRILTTGLPGTPWTVVRYDITEEGQEIVRSRPGAVGLLATAYAEARSDFVLTYAKQSLGNFDPVQGAKAFFQKIGNPPFLSIELEAQGRKQ